MHARSTAEGRVLTGYPISVPIEQQFDNIDK